MGNQDSMKSFDLSAGAYEMDSNHGSHANTRNFGAANTVDQGFFGNVPGLEGIDDSNEDGLITSDSDFDLAVKTAGYNPQDQNIGE